MNKYLVYLEPTDCGAEIAIKAKNRKEANVKAKRLEKKDEFFGMKVVSVEEERNVV